MAARIKKDDRIIVVSGDHKGATGKVLRVMHDKQRVLVEGVNMVYRHVRRSQQNPQGGRIQKEAPLHISNVMPLDTKSERGVRVRFEVQRDADGNLLKQRVSTGRGSSNAVLGDVKRPAKKSKGGND
ncbi:MAG: 50S ribosomal protein L24 [Phycisphaerae bacterium]|nr:50S ribosomal protein L24 [Phycisphaerae bacterium]